MVTDKSHKVSGSKLSEHRSLACVVVAEDGRVLFATDQAQEYLQRGPKGAELGSLLRGRRSLSWKVPNGRVLANTVKLHAVAPTESSPPSALVFMNFEGNDQWWNSVKEKLTDREVEVGNLLLLRASPVEIAAELRVAVATVNVHAGNIYKKLGLRSRAEFTHKARITLGASNHTPLRKADICERTAVVSQEPPAMRSSRRDKSTESDDSFERTKKGLTPRQLAVLELLFEGRSNKQIARTLDVSTATVKVHVSQLHRAFHVKNRIELLRKALEAYKPLFS